MDLYLEEDLGIQSKFEGHFFSLRNLKSRIDDYRVVIVCTDEPSFQ